MAFGKLGHEFNGRGQRALQEVLGLECPLGRDTLPPVVPEELREQPDARHGQVAEAIEEGRASRGEGGDVRSPR